MENGGGAVAHHFWDTHCHLNDPGYRGREEALLRRAVDAGVGKIVVPAYDKPSVARTWELAAAHPGLALPAIGAHPWYITGQQDWEWLAAEIRRPGCRAVGEIGLDGYPGAPSMAAQEWWFDRQLELAAELKLPALIHCRRAFPRLLQALRRFSGAVTPVLHAFGGSWEMAQECLRWGAYLSFAGTLTLSNARKAWEVARRAPEEAILIETDGPSIGLAGIPAAGVGPEHVVAVARSLAAARSCPLEAIARATSANARRVFGGD